MIKENLKVQLAEKTPELEQNQLEEKLKGLAQSLSFKGSAEKELIKDKQVYQQKKSLSLVGGLERKI